LAGVIAVVENLVEGYFVITKDNLVFEIKGVIHPRDRVIAYLRYVPTTGMGSDSDIGYRKVYELTERETYLQNNYPSYLWFSDPHGRVVQSVHRDRIESILDPVDCLTNFRSSVDKISDLEQASVNLAEKLVKSTGIEWMDIGITGSQLVGIAREDSDIDLVVYGSSACRKFYSNLSKNIASIENVKRYTGTLVKTPGDLEYVYGDVSYQMKGQQLVSGKVVDDSESMFTPCEYLVECDDSPNLRKLVSYRGRFTEQISKGASFEALGRLEMVTDHRKNNQYLQLVLGELPNDYLIPRN
jgi:predicted nucleotidyltransferase